MGGGLALHTAARNNNLGAVAAFYGGGAPEAEAFANNQAAILNIVGDQDRVLSSIQSLEQAFQNYTFPHELVVYPNAQHAFFNDSRPHIYDKKSADDAWTRTLNWFNRYLAN
jgi:carboxymethylenebutenolidase